MSAQTLTVADPSPLDGRDDLLVDLVDRPELFDVGTALNVADAAVGIADVGVHAAPSLRLLARPVTRATVDGNGVTIHSGITGLVGALGPLPPAYTELARRQSRTRAGGMVAFFDLFATRLLRLFVGAGEKYRLPVLTRWRGLTDGNGVVAAVFALAGFGTPHLRAANRVGDRAVLRHAGLLANRTRSAAGLEAILAAEFGHRVQVEQFRGRWLDVDPGELTRLGPGGGNRLGVTAIAGVKVYDRQGGFRVTLGPLAFRDYAALAPGSAAMARLAALTRLYAGLGVDFDVKLILRREDVPETKVAGDGARLGWNTWVRLAPARADADDAVIRPDARAEAA